MTRLATIQTFGPATIRREHAGAAWVADCDCGHLWVRGSHWLAARMADNHWRRRHPNYPLPEPADQEETTA